MTRVSAAHETRLAIQIGAAGGGGCGNGTDASHCQPLLSWNRWMSWFDTSVPKSEPRSRLREGALR
jgi:hypothetical protein